MTQRLILLIESDQSIRDVLKVCLHQIGKWDVISVSSVQEALALLETILPDAILCDEPMSEIGDLISFTPLTAYAPSIPILLISSKAGWFSEQQLHQMGMVSAIAKPFNPLTLPAQIAQILNWSVKES